MLRVKICGVTSVEDAIACVDAGADALGINFWAGSARCCEVATARAIARAVGGRATVVGVFVDESVATVRATLRATGIEWAQLHGQEPPSAVEALLPRVYKALRAFGPEVATEARRYPGEHLLLDASVPGRPGGTGRTFDWALAEAVACERQLLLAGGLTPDNVAAAVARARPAAIDVASGVERSPGRKDPARVRALVDAARQSG